jgi:peptidyl-prolyl cis-trans isomerase SurA
MIPRPYRFCAVIAIAGALLFFFPGISCGVTVDRILATIDDQVITFADYKLFTKDLTDGQSGDGIDENLLRHLIEEKLIAREAVRRGLEASDSEVEKAIEEFKSLNNLSQDDLEIFLKEDGTDLEKFRTIVRERILISQMLGSEVDAKVLITDPEIEEFYLVHKREFLDSPEYVELNAIFFLLREGSSLTEITDMKRRALRIVALLRDGDNFERLVDEYSDEPLRSHRGVLGKFARGALIAPIDRKAFAMKEGEISDPIWVGDGVFILRLIKRTDETYKPVEEVRAEIYNDLFEQKREKVLNDWIKSLWEKFSVKMHQS